MGMYDVDTPSQRARGWAAALEDRPQLPYLLPFLAFVGVMAPGALFGDLLGIPWKQVWFDYQPAVYTAKTLLAAGLLWLFWRHYTPIRWTHLGVGVLLGVVGMVAWVGVEYLRLNLFQALGFPRPSAADLYDPVKQIPQAHWRYLYYVIRVGGPTLVVPVMEELFFRDFLMRALVRGARFQDVAVGTFTWFSFLGTAVLFGVDHGRMWPGGIVYGLLMGGLLVRTKSLGACIVAHGVTNFLLYAYCIYAGDWQFM